MSLRIIGGTFRNRLLASPLGTSTRPTLAIMRKALFDICQEQIEGAHFLDLFAGSGAIGLEAISRGAASATFVENHRHAIHCIRQNVKSLEVDTQTEIIGADVLKSLKKLAASGRQFDIIYADPPYATSPQSSLLPGILSFCDSCEILKPQGLLFVEEAAPAYLHPKEQSFTHLKYLNSRQFSQSTLHQFTRING